MNVTQRTRARHCCGSGCGALLCLLFALWHPLSVAAHGGPPAVSSVLSFEGDDAQIVGLNEGLALRGADGFRYVCPARWGDSEGALGQSLSRDTLVIGGERGLFVMDAQEGAVVMPHPSAQASEGRVVAFARAGAALFALRAHADLHDIVRIEDERLDVIWSDARAWSALAASEQALHVLRIDGLHLERLELSLQGAKITSARVRTPGSEAFIELSARVTRGALYVTALTFAGTVLAPWDDARWKPLCRADDSLTGPVESDGQLLVALDGALHLFDEACAQPIATAASVSGVADEGDRAQVCTEDGVNLIAGAGVGLELFQLRALRPPELAGLDEATSAQCCAQWQRYQQDFVAFGLVASATRCDGAVEAPAGRAGPADGASQTRPATGSDPGCAVGAPGSDRSTIWLGCALLGAAGLKRRLRDIGALVRKHAKRL